jgi:DNA-binding HxlR family transcriptional regulator
MKKIELLAWVARGSQRRVIIKVIVGAKIPAQIYQEAMKINPKITRNSVSDVLREFVKKGLVVCINPEETKGRFYRLTALGEKIRKEFV